jgi:hypothetical protein
MQSTHAAHRPTPDQVLIAVCLVAAMVFYGLTSNLVSLLGRSHQHIDSNVKASAVVSAATATARVPSVWFTHRIDRKNSRHGVHDHPHAAPTDAVQHADQDADHNASHSAGSNTHHHSHSTLQRHHHDTADATVQSAEPASGDALQSGEASNALGLLPLIVEAAGSICVPTPSVRLLRWQRSANCGVPDGHARLPERPPKA